jgi:hypothetical protein
MPSLPPKDPYNSARERAQRIEPAMATYVFPLIRTLTVGLGISPSPPLAGCKRVADFDCRFGITPTPETTVRVYFGPSRISKGLFLQLVTCRALRLNSSNRDLLLAFNADNGFFRDA